MTEAMLLSYEYVLAKHRHNFNKVKDPSNWKMPTVEKTVRTELEANAIREAVMYFTGGIPDIVAGLLATRDGRVGIWYTVKASAGYYMVIGA